MMITRGYGIKAKAIVTRGITWLGEVLYSLPRCITRRQPILKSVSAYPGDIAISRIDQEMTIARTAIDKTVRRSVPANRIVRRKDQELIFRDVKPCRM